MIFTNTLTKRKKQKILYNINTLPNKNQNLINTIFIDDQSNKKKEHFVNFDINNINSNSNILNINHLDNLIKPTITNKNVSLTINEDISNIIENSSILNNVKKETQIDINNISINNIKQINTVKLNYILENIKLIINVYQEEYVNNKKASGFGDFIRGSYFLIQFCTKYKIKYNIDLTNHSLSNFLKNSIYKFNQTNNNFDYNNITPFIHNNFIPKISESNILYSKTDIEIEAHFIDYLYEQYYNKTNKNGIQLIYTISFPNKKVNKQEKQIMRYILEPSNYINQKVFETVNLLSFNLKKYNIIHIRCGDNLLVNKETKIDLQIINNIFNNLNNLFMYNTNNNYLLLADNNYIKKIILDKYTNTNINIKTIFNEITHLGEGVVSSLSSIENTIIEFYLISLSNNIYSMSIYEHGSGFSKWCAETYNIPYICKFIG